MAIQKLESGMILKEITYNEPLYEFDTENHPTEEVVDQIFKIIEPLPLGNNFTYSHFFESMPAKTIVDLYNNLECDNTVVIIAINRYGQKIRQVTCAFDIHCHINELYDIIDYCEESDTYYYVQDNF